MLQRIRAEGSGLLAPPLDGSTADRVRAEVAGTDAGTAATDELARIRDIRARLRAGTITRLEALEQLEAGANG